MSSNYDNVVKLTIAHLKPKMVIAEDAVNKLGVVVLAKNSVLTTSAFERLSKNQVVNVSVWENSIVADEKCFVEQKETPKIPLNPITNKKEFKKFSNAYQKRVEELKNSFETLKRGESVPTESLYSVVDSLVSVVEYKSVLFQYTLYLNGLDEFNYTHSINVSIFCNVLAKWLNLSDAQIKEVTIAGLLHDIGKANVDKSIIDKETDLNENEMLIYRNHPRYSYEMLSDLDASEEVKDAVLMHHERIDGTGYPLGLNNDQINDYAKIVAICDEFDYLISKKKINPFEVIKDFRKQYISHLDTKYLIKFCEHILYVYIGSWVRLSNGKKGEVIFISNIHPDKPIVSVNGELIPLETTEGLYIKSML